jgi:hypothetical protein
VQNRRNHKTGGGVGIYLASELEFNHHNDITFDDPCIESIFIEICRPKGKNIIPGIIYRPPNQSVGEFVKSTEILMTNISKENKLCYLMGDFNLNLMNYHCHQFTNEFLDIMYSNMFFPLITRPTRIPLTQPRLLTTYLQITLRVTVLVVYYSQIYPITYQYFVFFMTNAPMLIRRRMSFTVTKTKQTLLNFMTNYKI